MLRSLRNPAGGPSLRARVLAVLVVLGFLVATAPVILVPLVRALLHAVGFG